MVQHVRHHRDGRASTYIIGDPHVIPRGRGTAITRSGSSGYPGCYLAFEVTYPVPDVAPPPFQRKPVRFTFGCLASQYKITPPVVRAWSRILAAAPDARLIVKNAAMKSADNQRFMADRLTDAGVDPARVQLDGPSEHFEFLQKYDHIDLALDTFPYNGGTTTMEALWQGVPVLTFDGDRWASRTSATLLRNAGLDQYVADDEDRYIQRAVEHATTPDRADGPASLRADMRSQLRGSPACDTRKLAQDMEAIYCRIWSSHPR